MHRFVYHLRNSSFSHITHQPGTFFGRLGSLFMVGVGIIVFVFIILLIGYIIERIGAFFSRAPAIPAGRPVGPTPAEPAPQSDVERAVREEVGPLNFIVEGLIRYILRHELSEDQARDLAKAHYNLWRVVQKKNEFDDRLLTRRSGDDTSAAVMGYIFDTHELK